MKPRLLVIASHPIQYQAPWFRALDGDGRIDLKVLFLSLPNQQQQGIGFGRDFEWDVPLLNGYEWELAPSARGSILDGWRGLSLQSPECDIRAQEVDAMLVTGWQNRGMLQCIIAARRLKLPLMIRAESNGLAPQGFLRKLKNRWIVKKAQMLLPIGQANHQFYTQLGATSRLGPEVPYFVDNSFFEGRADSARPERDNLRRKFGVPAEAVCFLFAGKFIEKKCPEDILKALQLVAHKSQQPVCLLMVGTGPLEAKLKGIVSGTNLPVKFAGFLNQTEIPSAYVAADCLVLPSDYGETWGLVVNEAMVCGVPAIVSDRVGCGPDLILEGETGSMFRFGDENSLADKMLEFANLNVDQRRAMGGTAKSRILQGYNIDLAVENTVAATFSLLAAGREETTH